MGISEWNLPIYGETLMDGKADNLVKTAINAIKALQEDRLQEHKELKAQKIDRSYLLN